MRIPNTRTITSGLPHQQKGRDGRGEGFGRLGRFFRFDFLFCADAREVGGGFDSFGFGGSYSPWFRRLVSSPGFMGHGSGAGGSYRGRQQVGGLPWCLVVAKRVV